MPKTVFFGGTFNPPHIAHRQMLEAVALRKDVEKVLVIPTYIPPHKEFNNDGATCEQRLFMCQLLCEGINKAIVSDTEIKRGGKSYSYDTLLSLKTDFPNLAMLIGGDMITTFTEWYRYLDILKLCEIFAVKRKGIDNKAFDEAVESLRLSGGTITVIDTCVPQISSTSLREALKTNVDISGLVPKNIADYISENNLYRGTLND